MGDYAGTIQQIEEVDGVRLSWNIWPNSKLEATKCIIPFGALYTPNKLLPSMPTLPYEPIPCKQCGAILNPYATVDYNSKVWTCPFCHTRNHFPSHYHGITESNLPAELYPNYSTIEYTMSRTIAQMPPVYVFVVDTCIAEDELQACKAAIMQALQTIPEYASVGLITYGTHVHVHELGFTECMKSWVFRGSKEYTPQQVVEQLGMGRAAQRPGQPGGQAPNAPTRKFIQQLGACEFQITQVLEELQKDAYPVGATLRPVRCTGTALQVAVGLLTASMPVGQCASRIMLFVGGPCTDGPGKVVSRELTEEIRSHKDLAKDGAPHWRKARKFYNLLSTELVNICTSLDVYNCSLDQIGLAEMKEAVQVSGGLTVQTDTFTNPVFKDSLKRMFTKEGEEGFLGIAAAATFEVIPSRDIKVSGLLGSAARGDKKTAYVSDTEVGLGGTSQWKLSSLSYDTTVAVFFEVTATNKETVDLPPGQERFFLQFITKYIHFSVQAPHLPETRCRVTTIARWWATPSSGADIGGGFDQEAAAVLMARLATHKMEAEEDFDATRWLDRNLIRLAARFGEYRKDEPSSFFMRQEMSFYPQFMFNLRRSQFVQVFGNSPDETAYCRLVLFQMATGDAMVMIQPQLSAYSFTSQQPEPVLLDVSSIHPERVLLLDSFFHIVVFHGTIVAQWRKAGYQLQAEHAAFAQLLSAPQEEAKELVKRRFPVPKVVDCDQNGSQARFLLAKLNPSSTYREGAPASSEVIMTDDVSLAVFTEHLKRLAVTS